MAYHRHSRYGQQSLDGYRFPQLPKAYRARNGLLFAVVILILIAIFAAIGVMVHALIGERSVSANGLLGHATPVKAMGLVMAGILVDWVLSDWIDARVEQAYWQSPMGQREAAEGAPAE